MNVIAECSRDGRFWLIHVPQIDGYTQAVSLDDVVAMTADLVSMKTGVQARDIQVEVHVEPVSA
jgi:hypothetical protein